MDLTHCLMAVQIMHIDYYMSSLHEMSDSIEFRDSLKSLHNNNVDSTRHHLATATAAKPALQDPPATWRTIVTNAQSASPRDQAPALEIPSLVSGPCLLASAPESKSNPLSQYLNTQHIAWSPKQKLPVICIFGSTPAFQKVCVHLHGVLPYFYVSHTELSLMAKINRQRNTCVPSLSQAEQVAFEFANRDPIECAEEIEKSLEAELAKVLNQDRAPFSATDDQGYSHNSSRLRHVFEVVPVKKFPIYGFYAEKQQLYKIVLFNPTSVRKASDLCASGMLAIFNRQMVFQPYESHIPFTQQALVDLNLTGMGFLFLKDFKFRLPLLPKTTIALGVQAKFAGFSGGNMNTEPSGETVLTSPLHDRLFKPGFENLYPEHTWSFDISRKSRCELEIDSYASDVMNTEEIRHPVCQSDFNSPNDTCLPEKTFLVPTLKILRDAVSSLVSPGKPETQQRQCSNGWNATDEVLKQRIYRIASATQGRSANSSQKMGNSAIIISSGTSLSQKSQGVPSHNSGKPDVILKPTQFVGNNRFTSVPYEQVQWTRRLSRGERDDNLNGEILEDLIEESGDESEDEQVLDPVEGDDIAIGVEPMNRGESLPLRNRWALDIEHATQVDIRNEIMMEDTGGLDESKISTLLASHDQKSKSVAPQFDGNDDDLVEIDQQIKKRARTVRFGSESPAGPNKDRLSASEYVDRPPHELRGLMYHGMPPALSNIRHLPPNSEGNSLTPELFREQFFLERRILPKPPLFYSNKGDVPAQCFTFAGVSYRYPWLHYSSYPSADLGFASILQGKSAGQEMAPNNATGALSFALQAPPRSLVVPVAEEDEHRTTDAQTGVSVRRNIDSAGRQVSGNGDGFMHDKIDNQSVDWHFPLHSLMKLETSELPFHRSQVIPGEELHPSNQERGLVQASTVPGCIQSFQDQGSSALVERSEKRNAQPPMTTERPVSPKYDENFFPIKQTILSLNTPARSRNSVNCREGTTGIFIQLAANEERLQSSTHQDLFRRLEPARLDLSTDKGSLEISSPNVKVDKCKEVGGSAQTPRKASKVSQGQGVSKALMENWISMAVVEIVPVCPTNRYADPKSDPIGIVSIVIHHTKEKRVRSYVIVNQEALTGNHLERYETENIDSTGLYPCDRCILAETEESLYQATLDIVRDHDVDILCGFNVGSQSLGYMSERFIHRQGSSCLKHIESHQLPNCVFSRYPSFPAALSRFLDLGPPSAGGTYRGKSWNVDVQEQLANQAQEALHSNTKDEEPESGDPLLRSLRQPENQQEDRSAEFQNAILYFQNSVSAGIDITGRHVISVWRVARSELKLNNYTLENVAAKVLGLRLPLLRLEVLSAWIKDPQMVSRAIHHVLRQAFVVEQLVNAMGIVRRTSELARVFGLDFMSVLVRGSQFRVESILARASHRLETVLLAASREQVFQQPAVECLPLIMEPESGIYYDPVTVLDFQSLYPSMIIAHNLCYSTMLGSVTKVASWDEDKRNLGVVQNYHPPPLNDFVDGPDGLSYHLYVSPNGETFVDAKVKRGILSQILSEILQTRIIIKQAMKVVALQSQRVKSSPSSLDENQEDGYEALSWDALNARQFGLKMIANVTYGYAAASFSGRMPSASLADSIVQCGRSTLERTVHLISNKHHSLKARVVYSDTDSLFVQYPQLTREEAFSAGSQLESYVTSCFPVPVALKFEKVYHPCILCTKKRYVGLSFESPSHLLGFFDAKGIETVRRDSIPLVAQTMERSLRILFESRDVSRLKAYLQSVFGNVFRNSISLSSYVFRHEVRPGTYKKESALPPAAVVSMDRIKRYGHRGAPQYKERVCFVVAYLGADKTKLRSCVLDPEQFLEKAKGGQARLHVTYYIEKQLVPSLNRLFNLCGIDVQTWYRELPRPYMAPLRVLSTSSSQPKIYDYFASNRCVLCQSRTGPENQHVFDQSIVVDTSIGREHDSAAPMGVGAGSTKHRLWDKFKVRSGTRAVVQRRFVFCNECFVYDRNRTLHILSLARSRAERGASIVEDLCQGCMSFQDMESANPRMKDGKRNDSSSFACISSDCEVYFLRHRLFLELVDKDAIHSLFAEPCSRPSTKKDLK